MNGEVYDAVMAGVERRALESRRRRTWTAVPRSGLGLELGAGTGANFRWHPRGSTVVATDVSFDMLARARGKPGSAGVPLVVCDAQHLPFRGGAFDWVAETLTFCEVADPDAALAEVARVARSGALFVLMEHVRPRRLLGVLADLVSLVTVPLFGEHFDRSPEPALERRGFRVLRRESLLWDVVVLVVARAPGAAEAAA